MGTQIPTCQLVRLLFLFHVGLLIVKPTSEVDRFKYIHGKLFSLFLIVLQSSEFFLFPPIFVLFHPEIDRKAPSSSSRLLNNALAFFAFLPCGVGSALWTDLCVCRQSEDLSSTDWRSSVHFIQSSLVDSAETARPQRGRESGRFESHS